MIACVPARLPELSSTSTRSPRRSNTVILQNFAMLSRPALVRESDAKIMPSSSLTLTQYVTAAAPPSRRRRSRAADTFEGPIIAVCGAAGNQIGPRGRDIRRGVAQPRYAGGVVADSFEAMPHDAWRLRPRGPPGRGWRRQATPVAPPRQGALASAEITGWKRQLSTNETMGYDWRPPLGANGTRCAAVTSAASIRPNGLSAGGRAGYETMHAHGGVAIARDTMSRAPATQPKTAGATR